MEKYYITISREYGSGGRFIAQKLAKKLKLPYYDKQIIKKAAENSGLCETIVTKYDEKKEGYFRNVVINFPMSEISVPQKVFNAQAEVMKKFANGGSCIVVGRCADYILRDYENVINIFIYASKEEKLKRVINHYGITEKDAVDNIKKISKQRKNYYQHYTDRRWGDFKEHELMLSSDIGVEESVDVIYSYVTKYINKEK